MFEMKLPDIGEGVAEGEIVAWHIKPGMQVAENDILVEVMTDKATVEISSPIAGQVKELCYAEGDTALIGHVFIKIDDQVHESTKIEPSPPQKMEGKPEPSIQQNQANEEKETNENETLKHSPPVLPPRPGTQQTSKTSSAKIEAVPAVRRLAKELGIELSCVKGSGPNGRIMKDDLLNYRKSGMVKKQCPMISQDKDEGDWERKPLRGMRRAISETMTRSAFTIPHYTYVEEIDMTVLQNQIPKICERQKRKSLSPLAFISRACVMTLADFPYINASIDDDAQEIILKKKIHLGIAMSIESGLIVPVLKNAQDLTLFNIADQGGVLSEKAKAKQLEAKDMRGGTFTVSSLGKLGGLMATPIIRHPEVAIVGVHAIRYVPAYVDGQVKPRAKMNLSMSLDHRIIDGHEGALFVQKVKQILEQVQFPELEALTL